jgi:hypothetical protein
VPSRVWKLPVWKWFERKWFVWDRVSDPVPARNAVGLLLTQSRAIEDKKRGPAAPGQKPAPTRAFISCGIVTNS